MLELSERHTRKLRAHLTTPESREKMLKKANAAEVRAAAEFMDDFNGRQSRHTQIVLSI